MPRKNVIKQYQPNTYLHVYNRGVCKQDIFHEDADKDFFLGLFNRYLNPYNKQSDANRMPYPKFYDEIQIQAFCLMNNHYHLLLWLGQDPTALAPFMKSIGVSHTMYMNKRYGRVGPLLESKYKAVQVESEEQLIHLTRYIHLNPGDPFDYAYSSLSNYLGKPCPSWLQATRMLNIIRTHNYLEFMKSA